jgi:hypothetical protein
MSELRNIRFLIIRLVSVQASNKSPANSPVKSSSPEGPAPVLRDELAGVVAKQQYPCERLLRLSVVVCLILGINAATALAQQSEASQSTESETEIWRPYLLFSGGLGFSDRSVGIDGFHLGFASLWPLLTIAKTKAVRIETMLGVDALGGSWNDGYLFGLSADFGAALRWGDRQMAFFTMATWSPSILITQPASANTRTTPLGYRVLIGMSWYHNNFGVAWRSIARGEGSPYRAIEGFFGIGF